MIAVLLPAAMLVLLAWAVSGCLNDTVDTVTVEKAGTGTATQPDSTSADREAYRNSVNDVTARANLINSDYGTLIDTYNSGQAKADELQILAEQDRIAYEEMSRQITGMKVPKEFQEAHKLLISAFNKWQSAFEAYRDGYRIYDKNMLDKARDLDSQAVTEVQQAVNMIAQVG
jgi:hypothetical protein